MVSPLFLCAYIWPIYTFYKQYLYETGADEKFRGKLGELSKDGAHTIQEERNISNSMNLGSETLYLGIQ